jgi:hypothetical protein
MDRIEIILATNEITATAFSEAAIFYSTITAYMVVSYMVGSKLTTFQTALISFGFFMASLLGMLGVVAFNLQIREIQGMGAVGTTRGWADLSMYTVLLFRVLLTSGGLYFMWQVRHPRTESPLAH